MVDCTSLPSGNQTYNGQPFDIAGSNGGNNAWFSSVAANNGSGSVSLTIPVNVSGVVSAYTLMNTFWGQSGASYDAVTFTGSLGTVYTVTLMGNSDIRDYNNYIWTNSTGASGTINAWNNYASGGSQRLDEQIFLLPGVFASETLTSIKITDTGGDTFSRLFLAGLTLDTNDNSTATPEPASLLLTAAGLMAAGILGLRRRR